MGVYKELFDNYTNLKVKYFSTEMSLLELGDQDMIFDSGYSKLRDCEQSYYSKWTSLDLHNRPGVFIQDLADLSNNVGQWDVVTNFGTSEHVEPEQGHYNCWKNIHTWTKVGGYSVHDVPEAGSWPGHCRFYYSFEFFNEFRKIGYEILELKQVPYPQQGNLIFCCLKKVKETEFFNYTTFTSLITTDYNTDSNLVASENNPKNLTF